MKGAWPSVRALKKRKVRDTSITNKRSIIKQLTHASFGKNFLQGGDIHRDKTTVLPVAKGGWFEGNDSKDEEIVESERQQQTLDICHN